jgi:hypothetical protein
VLLIPVANLPPVSIRLVADIVEGEPSDTPYDDIKQWLVASHQLSDFQKKALPDARLGQQQAVGADGGHAGDLPQG